MDLQQFGVNYITPIKGGSATMTDCRTCYQKIQEDCMNKFFLIFATITMFSLAACQEQGPAERAGENIDEAIEEVGDEIDDAT